MWWPRKYNQRGSIPLIPAAFGVPSNLPQCLQETVRGGIKTPFDRPDRALECLSPKYLEAVMPELQRLVTARFTSSTTKDPCQRSLDLSQIELPEISQDKIHYKESASMLNFSSVCAKLRFFSTRYPASSILSIPLYTTTQGTLPLADNFQ